MGVKNEDVAEAVRAYVEEAIVLLLDRGTPRRTTLRDGWVREGDMFRLREQEQTSVDLFSLKDELRELDSFKRGIEALQNDEQMRPQFGPLGGSVIGFDRLIEEDILEHVLQEAVDPAGTGELVYDAERIRESYASVEEHIYDDHAVYAVLAPILGLEVEELPVELGDGVALDALTDSEAASCIKSGLIRPLGEFPAVRVGTLVGLRFELRLPKLMLADGSPPPADLNERGAAAFDAMTSRVDRVIQALRLLKPGTTATTGLTYFAKHPLHTGAIGWIPVSTSLRVRFARFEVSAEMIPKLQEIWKALSAEGVQRHKTLPIALRRFMYAGDRDRADDQLIDLMIALEALFLPGEKQELAFKLALRCAFFLKEERQPVRNTFEFVKRGYVARSALVHGSVLTDLKIPDGTHVTLDEFVDQTADVVRAALAKAIRIGSGKETGSLTNFDSLFLDV